jgi:hypothetical protein
VNEKSQGNKEDSIILRQTEKKGIKKHEKCGRTYGKHRETER